MAGAKPTEIVIQRSSFVLVHGGRLSPLYLGEQHLITQMNTLTLEAAREHLGQNDPDIILLDVGMPDGDGFSFCEEIREQTNAHIIFLTARKNHSEVVHGLGLGGELNKNKLLSAEDLYKKVWTQQMGTDKHVVQRRVSELRTSLADCCCTHTVSSVYGKGYCFEAV